VGKSEEGGLDGGRKYRTNTSCQDRKKGDREKESPGRGELFGEARFQKDSWERLRRRKARRGGLLIPTIAG